MKKIIYGLLATVTGVVLLLSYRTSLEAVAPTASSGTDVGTGTGGTATASGTSTSGTSTRGTGASGSSGSSTSSGGSGASGGLKDGTYTGAQAATRYGPVTVKVTVSGGTISEVTVPEYPTESFRDQEINRRAVPELVSETKSAQSADIDMVSGATYTSEGYKQSLQSALDEARA